MLGCLHVAYHKRFRDEYNEVVKMCENCEHKAHNRRIITFLWCCKQLNPSLSKDVVNIIVKRINCDRLLRQEVIWAIVGSRNFTNYPLLCSTVDECMKEWKGKPDSIVSGGAQGADSLAERWAKENAVNTIVYLPNWKKHGKAAGIIRNGDIIAEATHCIAFPSPSGRGTQNSIVRAQKKGIPIKVKWV